MLSMCQHREKHEPPQIWNGSCHIVEKKTTMRAYRAVFTTWRVVVFSPALHLTK